MTKAELKAALETVAHVAGPITTIVVVVRDLIERLPDDAPERAPEPEKRGKKG